MLGLRISGAFAGLMKKKEDESEEDFARVSEANFRPVEDDETEKVLKVVSKGAAWGVLAGLSISQFYMSTNSLFGFYIRDGGLVILGYCGTGLAIGALAGWLYTLIRRER